MPPINAHNIQAVAEKLLRQLEDNYPFPRDTEETNRKLSGVDGELVELVHLQLPDLWEMQANIQARESSLVLRLEAVFQVRKAIERDLNKTRNQLKSLCAMCTDRALQPSPITRPPNELLCMILQRAFGFHDGNTDVTRKRLLLVCRRWHVIISSDGRFWSHFSWRQLTTEHEGFAKSKRKAEHCLAMSSGAAPSLEISNITSLAEWQTDLLLQLPPKWKKLQIDYMGYIPIIRHVHEHLNNVEELSVDERALSPAWSKFLRTADPLRNDNPPSLRKACVDYRFLKAYPDIFRAVLKLKVIISQTDASFILAMPAMNTLISLSFSSSIFSVTSRVIAFTGLSFPCLLELNLDVCMDGDVLMQLIENLDAPRLNSLLWAPAGLNSWTVGYLVYDGMHIVARKWPKIQTFALFTKYDDETFDLSFVLRTLPNLSHFTIGYTDNERVEQVARAIRSMGSPTWACPLLQSLTVDIPSSAAFDTSLLVDVARERALSNVVPALKRLSLPSDMLEENERARLGLYVSELFLL